MSHSGRPCDNISAAAFSGIGMWLSLVERCVRDAEAAGSNPVIPTMSLRRGLNSVRAFSFCSAAPFCRLGRASLLFCSVVQSLQSRLRGVAASERLLFSLCAEVLGTRCAASGEADALSWFLPLCEDAVLAVVFRGYAHVHFVHGQHFARLVLF